MKLSEAIKAGAKLRPQVRGKLFKEVNGQMASCALGAALEGCGVLNPDLFEGDYQGAFAEVDLKMFDTLSICSSEFIGCPDCEDDDDLIPLIEHLNDSECWTREQIGHWLESMGC